MVGQIHLQQRIQDEIINKTLPQFIIIVGDKGSGKKVLASAISTWLTLPLAEFGNTVADVRECINMANNTKAVYQFSDVDTMSEQAKNALLKIVEEPPVYRYFIMTVVDEGSILDTLKNRARIIRMDLYTQEELRQYKPGLGDRYYKIADTPGMLDTLAEYGDDFIDYVDLVRDNIRDVESANAFKSGNKLALKNDTGYDLNVFFSAFISSCMNKCFTGTPCKEYLTMALLSSQFQTKSTKVGVNKMQLYDQWVFSIRQVR